MDHQRKNLNSDFNGVTKKHFYTVLSISIVTALICGVLIDEGGFWRSSRLKKDENYNQPLKSLDDSFVGVFSSSSYMNPRLQCGDINSFSNKFVYEIKDRVSDYINEAGRHPETLKSVSVYFRDLNGGPIFGIDEQAQFIPGSLLKLPLMLSLLKKAENDSEFLDKKIIYDGGGGENYDQFYKPKDSVTVGGTYSVGNLIGKMIVYSDNDSTLLLRSLLSDKEFKDSFEELGVGVPEDSKYTLSVQTYASYFRILYNASFLNRFLSGRALNLLAESDFKDGLVAGVPSSVGVAHKFGERSGEGLDQLHDCGIVYYPEHPYVLCVMTKGENFPDLAKSIKDISKIVYENIRREYPAK